jgi:hypothetical protein
MRLPLSPMTALAESQILVVRHTTWLHRLRTDGKKRDWLEISGILRARCRI